jgi:hypothetical protein
MLVHRVDGSTVIGEHCGERPADDLRAIVDDSNLAGELLADRFRAVVSTELFEHLDTRKWCAREDALLSALKRADVVVEAVAVLVAQPLYILFDGDHITQVGILLATKDGIIDKNAVGIRVLVSVY